MDVGTAGWCGRSGGVGGNRRRDDAKMKREEEVEREEGELEHVRM